MFLDVTVIKVIDKVLLELKNYSGVNSSILSLQNTVDLSDDKIRQQIVKKIVDSQAKGIKRSIMDGEDAKVSMVGSFLIKTKRKLFYKLRDILAKERGYNSYNEASKKCKEVIDLGLSPDASLSFDSEINDIRERRIEMYREHKRIQQTNRRRED